MRAFEDGSVGETVLEGKEWRVCSATSAWKSTLQKRQRTGAVQNLAGFVPVRGVNKVWESGVEDRILLCDCKNGAKAAIR